MINVTNVSEILDAMRCAVPPHKQNLNLYEQTVLRDLTGKLIAAKPEAVDEYARFLGISQRNVCGHYHRLRSRLGGATVLVTGGTGCIGSTLMAMIARYQPARLVSMSRGITADWPGVATAEYMIGDVRDYTRVNEIISMVKPDVIFHVVAQRSPALAEIEVHRTVTTNIFGTRNVMANAIACDVPQVVCASTGKALRPYSPEIYTASKRVAEWIAGGAASTGSVLVSAARFTHVMDNSIVHRKMMGGALGGLITLHAPDIVFYVQSALESAQLLLLAYLGARPYQFRVHAITDLGWPVSLTDVAIGVLRMRGSGAPIYISGYDPGYEEVSFPGLYDQKTAGDVSPLLNAFETAAMTDSPCPNVDAFDLRINTGPDDVAVSSIGFLDALEHVCEHTQDPVLIRSILDYLSWSLLADTLSAVPKPVLERTVDILNRPSYPFSETHIRIAQAIREWAKLEDMHNSGIL